MPEPLTPVILVGRHVRLEPLQLEHAESLVASASVDRSTFDLTPVPDSVGAMRIYISELLADQSRAKVLPFMQRSVETGQPVGCTRYLDPHWIRGRREPDEIEVGGTWLSATAQRTGINTEAKYLLFTHAFETLGVWRLALCTDADNRRSRDAIIRLGASFEGVLRNHRLVANTAAPVPRQTAVYSVISEEWPTVKSGLEDRLAATP